MKTAVEKYMFLGFLLIVVVTGLFAAINLHLIGRVMHFVFPPSDLYKPTIVDPDFRWDLDGEAKRYELPCDHFDIYEVGMSTDKKVLHSGLFNSGGTAFRFHGKLQVRILKDSKVLYEAIVMEPLATWYFERDDNYISHISFVTFPMPLRGYCNGLQLEVKVLSADNRLQTAIAPQLYVRVSAIP